MGKWPLVMPSCGHMTPSDEALLICRPCGVKYNALAKRIETLEKAMRKYGLHNFSCRKASHWGIARELQVCDCGLDAALNPEPVAKEEK